MKNKQLVKNMITTIIAFTINVLISFFLAPYIIENVSTEAYGFVSLANNFIMYASLITVAINSMAARFITIKMHQNNIEEANKYFTSTLIANIIFVILLLLPSAIVVFFLDNLLIIPSNIILDVKLLFAFMFINFFISIICSTYSTAAFIKNRLDISAKVNILSYIIKIVILLILFYLLIPKVMYIGIASCCVSIYCLIANVYYTKKLIPEVEVNRKHFDIKKIIELIKSGVWNTITKLGQILTDGLDLLITNLFINPLAMGQLAIVKTITTTLSTFISTIAGVFSPQLTIDYAKENKQDLINDIKFSMKITSAFSSIFLSFFVVFGVAFYTLWVPNENIELLNILSLLSLAPGLLLSSIVPLWQVFTITNKLKVNSLVTVGTGLLNVLLVYIIIKTTDFGIYAVAGVSSLTAIIKNITYVPLYAANCLETKKNIFYSEIFKGILITGIVIATYYVISKIIIVNTWGKLILAIIACGFFGLIINFLLLLTRSDREQLISGFKKVLKGKKQ